MGKMSAKLKRSTPAPDPEVNAAFPISRALEILRRESENWPTPAVTVYADRKATAYEVLVATILSLRTKDRATAEASAKLLALARDPAAMLRLSAEQIELAIYPVGFYRVKARTLLDISRALIDLHGGRTPDTVEELIKLKGVGRKTANLVVTLGHGKQGICVDVHVHRITNRWGYLTTKTPEQTEFALRRALPSPYWIPINDWLVAFGQNVCKPVSPLCSQCRLADVCGRRGVGKSR